MRFLKNNHLNSPMVLGPKKKKSRLSIGRESALLGSVVQDFLLEISNCIRHDKEVECNFIKSVALPLGQC